MVDDPPGCLVEALATRGIAVVRGVVPAPLLGRLSSDVDRALDEELAEFPPGDDQHGRLLFAPQHGGSFLELLELEALFGPMEAILGRDSIVYTMTTASLEPGSAGPVDDFHVDLPSDRPDGQALGASVLVDPFSRQNGCTEFLAGSHRGLPADACELVPLVGQPGDVCFFDPRVRHRGTPNRSDRRRRAVLVQLIRPWMKQRFDVTRMLPPMLVDSLSPVAARRLGLTSVPPGSRAEFRARRERRPWSP